jgi:ankyrin repeat protein
MYDPEQSNPHTIELLEICASNNFSLWDSQDAVGWTIMHRAAAFGQRRDIQKLVNLGASLNIFVHNLRWQPIHCSVRYGNESTFDYLASLMGASVLVALKDSRGWSLLHLAAEGGSEALIVKLLQFGLDPRERSDASTRSVPADLEMQELLPADIAKSCGNEQAFERAIAFWAAGYPTQLQET